MLLYQVLEVDLVNLSWSFTTRWCRYGGGSPATEPLPFGVQCSQQTSDGVTSTNSLDIFEDNSADENLHAPVSPSPSLAMSDEELDIDNEVAASKDDLPTSHKGGNVNQIPKLIDNKRKKMERQLSAAQCDKLFLRDEKEEKEFRRELCKSIKESNSVTTFIFCTSTE